MKVEINRVDKTSILEVLIPEDRWNDKLIHNYIDMDKLVSITGKPTHEMSCEILFHFQLLQNPVKVRIDYRLNDQYNETLSKLYDIEFTNREFRKSMRKENIELSAVHKILKKSVEDIYYELQREYTDELNNMTNEITNEYVELFVNAWKDYKNER